MIKKTFTFGNYSYNYFLVFQDRKTLSLTIHPNLKIILKCPNNCEETKINNFLKRKWNWIEKQINFFKKFRKNPGKKEFVSGESFLYLGRQYKLTIKNSNQTKVKLEKNKLTLFTNESLKNEKLNKKLLNNWFEERTKIVFNSRLNQMLKKFDYESPPKLTIRKMLKRWGSCFSNKRIILNPLLIHSSKQCIDYVIVHELCHFKHKKHDKNFYKLQESIIPNWKKIKENLEIRLI